MKTPKLVIKTGKSCKYTERHLQINSLIMEHYSMICFWLMICKENRFNN